MALVALVEDTDSPTETRRPPPPLDVWWLAKSAADPRDFDRLIAMAPDPVDAM